MKKKISISKLDAAKRQLETVIRLYFTESDPVSIHTLTAAAYNIIRDVNKKRQGNPMMIKEMTLDYVKPGYEQEIINKINEAENFFKHANRDHDQSVDLNPDITELMIFDACLQYRVLTGEHPPLFQVFLGWLSVDKPHLFDYPADSMEVLKNIAPDLTSLGKLDFFNNLLPVIMTFSAMTS